jgi:hypothetical protein
MIKSAEPGGRSVSFAREITESFYVKAPHAERKTPTLGVSKNTLEDGRVRLKCVCPPTLKNRKDLD